MKHITYKRFDPVHLLDHKIFLRSVQTGRRYLQDMPPKHVSLALQYADQRFSRKSLEFDRRVHLRDKRRPAKPQPGG